MKRSRTLIYKTEKRSKSSHLRTWYQRMFGAFIYLFIFYNKMYSIIKTFYMLNFRQLFIKKWRNTCFHHWTQSQTTTVSRRQPTMLSDVLLKTDRTLSSSIMPKACMQFCQYVQYVHCILWILRSVHCYGGVVYQC